MFGKSYCIPKKTGVASITKYSTWWFNFQNYFLKNPVRRNRKKNGCITCQAKSEEAFRCPKKLKNFDALSLYGEFFEIVSQFKKLNYIPVDLPYEAVLAQILFEENASWHHS